MSSIRMSKWILCSAVVVSLTACGGGGLFGSGKEKGTGLKNDGPVVQSFDSASKERAARREANGTRSTIWDLFSNNNDPNVTLEVNKYLWKASQDVLSFMPIEAADPFTGTISMGYGRPQGGGAAYRATVFITDPALDARSLRVALQGAGGRAVSTATQRAVEDAILTRARQLRIADGKL